MDRNGRSAAAVSNGEQAAVAVGQNRSASATHAGAGSGSAGPAGPPQRCFYERPVVAVGAGSAAYGPATVLQPEDGLSYYYTCVDPTSGVVLSRRLVTYQTPVAAPAVTGIEVAQAALASLGAPTPTFETSPAHDKAQIVGLRTWIWLAGPLQPVSATASIAGVSATVTATPTGLRIDPGDGHAAFACTHATVAYDPAHPDRTPDCSYLYEHRSTSDRQPDGTFAMTVTATYATTWTATTGEGGNLTPLQATATNNLLVREIQAVIN